MKVDGKNLVTDFHETEPVKADCAILEQITVERGRVRISLILQKNLVTGFHETESVKADCAILEQITVERGEFGFL